MKHNAEWMRFCIQKAIYDFRDRVPVNIRESASLRVAELSAEELASIAQLPEDSVWRLYQCHNWTVERITKKLSLSGRTFRFMYELDEHDIARAVLRGVDDSDNINFLLEQGSENRRI